MLMTFSAQTGMHRSQPLHLSVSTTIAPLTFAIFINLYEHYNTKFHNPQKYYCFIIKNMININSRELSKSFEIPIYFLCLIKK